MGPANVREVEHGQTLPDYWEVSPPASNQAHRIRHNSR